MSNEKRYTIVPVSPELHTEIKGIAEDMARFSEPLGKALLGLDGTQEEKQLYKKLAEGPFSWYAIIEDGSLFTKIFLALEHAGQTELAHQLSLYKQEHSGTDDEN